MLGSGLIKRNVSHSTYGELITYNVNSPRFDECRLMNLYLHLKMKRSCMKHIKKKLNYAVQKNVY